MTREGGGERRILLLPGDGVGPEVTAAAARVLARVRDLLRDAGGPRLTWSEAAIGGSAIDAAGDPLPPETLAAAERADAVLLGAVGGPRWDSLPPQRRPETGLLGLRRALGVYANLRPTALLPGLASRSPLRAAAVQGLDCLLVRELTGGIYYGAPRGRSGEGSARRAVDTMVYGEHEIRRIAHVAFRAARSRRRSVTSVDKANVLENSRLWREVVAEVGQEYPDVDLSHQLVDSMAMLLVLRPAQYDVILAENLFGDILSDELGGVVGSLGVLASASIGDGGPGIYEPVHGSAPDIAGQDRANPLGAILSLALLFEHGLGMAETGRSIADAAGMALAQGLRTPDIHSEDGETLVGTAEMGRRVADLVSLPTADLRP